MRSSVKRNQFGLWDLSVVLAVILMGQLIWNTPSANAQSYEAARIYNQAIEQYNRGNSRAAMDLFNQALQKDPNYVDAHFNIGTILFHQGQYKQAETAFRRVVQLAPQDDEAKYNLGLALEKQQRKAEAVQVLRLITPRDAAYARAQDAIRRIGPVQGYSAQRAKPPSKPPSKPTRPVATATSATKFSVDTFAQGFHGPTGMAVANGSLFVANYSKHLIYRVDPKGGKQLFVEGSGLNGPVGLVYNPAQREFYVANYLGNNISRISPEGKVSVLASGLKKPYYLMLDIASNALYVSEQGSNTVSRIILGRPFQ